MIKVAKLLNEAIPDMHLMTTAVFEDGTRWYMGEKWEAFKLPNGEKIDRAYGDQDNLPEQLAHIETAYREFYAAGFMYPVEHGTMTAAEFEECFFALSEDRMLPTNTKKNSEGDYDVTLKTRDGAVVVVGVNIEEHTFDIESSTRELTEDEVALASLEATTEAEFVAEQEESDEEA